MFPAYLDPAELVGQADGVIKRSPLLFGVANKNTLFDFNTKGYADASWQGWCDQAQLLDEFEIYNWCERFAPEMTYIDPLSDRMWQQTKSIVKGAFFWIDGGADGEIRFPFEEAFQAVTEPIEKMQFVIEFEPGIDENLVHFQLFFL